MSSGLMVRIKVTDSPSGQSHGEFAILKIQWIGTGYTKCSDFS